MKIVYDSITAADLSKMSEKMYDSLVKAVVDVNKEIMVVDAELHVDEERLLIEGGSEQKDLWGINIYPHKIGSDDWIEFDSMINLRPSQGNRSRSVDDIEIQKRILKIVERLVK